MISQFLVVHHCCIFPRKRPAQSGFEGSLRTRLCDGVSSPRGRVRRGLWVNLVVQAQVSLALPFALPSGETCPSSATKRAPVPRVGTRPVQDGEETQTRHAKHRASASTFLSSGSRQSVRAHGLLEETLASASTAEPGQTREASEPAPASPRGFARLRGLSTERGAGVLRA